MASIEKKKYIARVGINFDLLKGKPRVEAGQAIPDAATDKDIADLLAINAITEAPKSKTKEQD